MEEILIIKKESLKSVPEAQMTNNVTQVLKTEYETTLTGIIVKRKTSEISVNEVLAIPDIPLAAHEIAVIFQFVTSYELVN